MQNEWPATSVNQKCIWKHLIWKQTKISPDRMLNYISFHTAELDKIQITIIAALLIRPVFQKNGTSSHEICNFDQNFGKK